MVLCFRTVSSRVCNHGVKILGVLITFLVNSVRAQKETASRFRMRQLYYVGDDPSTELREIERDQQPRKEHNDESKCGRRNQTVAMRIR